MSPPPPPLPPPTYLHSSPGGDPEGARGSGGGEPSQGASASGASPRGRGGGRVRRRHSESGGSTPYGGGGGAGGSGGGLSSGNIPPQPYFGGGGGGGAGGAFTNGGGGGGLLAGAAAAAAAALGFGPASSSGPPPPRVSSSGGGAGGGDAEEQQPLHASGASAGLTHSLGSFSKLPHHGQQHHQQAAAAAAAAAAAGGGGGGGGGGASPHHHHHYPAPSPGSAPAGSSAWRLPSPHLHVRAGGGPGGHHHHPYHPPPPSSSAAAAARRRSAARLVAAWAGAAALAVVLLLALAHSLALAPMLPSPPAASSRLAAWRSGGGGAAATPPAREAPVALAGGEVLEAGASSSSSSSSAPAPAPTPASAAAAAAVAAAARRGGAVMVGGDFTAAFDVDGDGVLSQTEFEAVVAEACALEAASLTARQRLRRAASLSFLLRSPCARPSWLLRGAAPALRVGGERSGGAGGGLEAPAGRTDGTGDDTADAAASAAASASGSKKDGAGGAYAAFGAKLAADLSAMASAPGVPRARRAALRRHAASALRSAPSASSAPLPPSPAAASQQQQSRKKQQQGSSSSAAAGDSPFATTTTTTTTTTPQKPADPALAALGAPLPALAAPIFHSARRRPSPPPHLPSSAIPGGGGPPETEADARRRLNAPGCGPATPALLRAAAGGRFGRQLLLVGLDWSSFEAFGVNWITHAQRSGARSYLVAAMDRRTAEFMRSHRLGRCVEWWPERLSTDADASAAGAASADDGDGDASSSSSSLSQQQQQLDAPSLAPLPAEAPPFRGSRSPSALASGWRLIELARAAASLGLDLVAGHADALWLNDPLEYVGLFARAHDFAAASDAPLTENPAGDVGLELRPQLSRHASSAAFFVAGSGAAGRGALDAWAAARWPAVGEESSSTDNNNEEERSPNEALRAWLRAAEKDALKPQDARALVLRTGATHPALTAAQAAAHPRFPSARVGLFSPAVFLNGYSKWVSRLDSRNDAARLAAGAPQRRAGALGAHVGGPWGPALGGGGGGGGGGAPPLSSAWGGLEARVHRMREAGWYADGPKYYSDPLLVSVALPGGGGEAGSGEGGGGGSGAPSPSSPPLFPQGFNGSDDGAWMRAEHARAVRAQLKEVKAGMAVALSTGRTLVLPRLWCGCVAEAALKAARGAGVVGAEGPAGGDEPADAAPTCRAPGDPSSSLPFPCPADYALDVAALHAYPPAHDNRRLVFREAGFAENERLPGWVAAARTDVVALNPPPCAQAAATPSERASVRCADPDPSRPPAGVNQVVLAPEGLQEGELAALAPGGAKNAGAPGGPSALLAPYADARWLHFRSASRSWQGFPTKGGDPARAQAFEAFVDRVVLREVKEKKK